MPGASTYDAALLKDAPEIGKQDIQKGYSTKILHETQNAPSSSSRTNLAQRGNTDDTLETSALAPGAVEAQAPPPRKRKSAWKTPKMLVLYGVVVVAVIVAAVVGGVLGSRKGDDKAEDAVATGGAASTDTDGQGAGGGAGTDGEGQDGQGGGASQTTASSPAATAATDAGPGGGTLPDFPTGIGGGNVPTPGSPDSPQVPDDSGNISQVDSGADVGGDSGGGGL